MSIVAALVCIFIGGVVNGSFALPTKNIKQWRFENVWLNYAIWAYLILPWISILILAPQVALAYQNIPPYLWTILILGGLGFGIGQACFAQSLTMIGFGLGFVINIGLGTGLGFLLPLIIFHPEKIFTAFGLATFIGIALIALGLVISYRAGKQRDIHSQLNQANASPKTYPIGVLLAVIAGFCSALQNFTFAATHDMQTKALNLGLNHLAASMIIWPVFLIFSFITYGLYMIYLHRKYHSFSNYANVHSGINWVLTLIMALCWYSSLMLYSQASLVIGNLGPVVGWPLFMVLIILTANFWGWRHHEWAHVPAAISKKALKAIGLLIIAVLVLAYSATLS